MVLLKWIVRTLISNKLYCVSTSMAKRKSSDEILAHKDFEILTWKTWDIYMFVCMVVSLVNNDKWRFGKIFEFKKKYTRLFWGKLVY